MEQTPKKDIRELSDRVRELSLKTQDVDVIHQALKALAHEFGYGVFAVYLRLIFQVDVSPKEGLTLWKEMVLHHEWMRSKVSDIDYRSSFFDYLLRKRGLLKQPVVLERQQFERVVETSFTDELTKLYNLRFLRQSLERELKRAGRNQKDCSLLFLDIDHFKRINDRYGHPVGDEVLKAVAHVIMDSARITDFPARYGGEEFAILAPETDLAGATLLAERIRKRIEELKLPDLGQQGITLSVGVACYPAHATTPVDLIAAADKALYEAKASGRNRVVAYQIAQEKRSHVRHHAKIRGTVNSKLYRSKIPFQTRNISEKGLLCEMAAPLQVGTHLDLELDMGQGKSVRCRTQVVRVVKPISTNAYEVGFSITELATVEEKEFKQLIHWCESHPVTTSPIDA